MGFNTFPCNPYPISTEELNKGNNDDLNTRVAALESDVSDLNSNKANQITIAPFFNAETAYTAGDLVYYNGLTYLCTNDHEGAWDADDFAATTVSNELATLKSGLMSRAVILGGGEISSNSSATVQLLSSHLYIVTLGHPYSEAGMAIVASYTSGSNKVTWIKTRAGVTISEDSGLVLTIAAEASVWYTVVDMGAI